MNKLQGVSSGSFTVGCVRQDHASTSCLPVLNCLCCSNVHTLILNKHAYTHTWHVYMTHTWGTEHILKTSCSYSSRRGRVCVWGPQWSLFLSLPWSKEKKEGGKEEAIALCIVSCWKMKWILGANKGPLRPAAFSLKGAPSLPASLPASPSFLHRSWHLCGCEIQWRTQMYPQTHQCKHIAQPSRTSCHIEIPAKQSSPGQEVVSCLMCLGDAS
jgi:hypothetical protein